MKRAKKWLLRRKLKKKIDKAFEPYEKGEKPFWECQNDALVACLSKPFEENN